MQSLETIKDKIQQFQQAVQDPKYNRVVEELLNEAFQRADYVQVAKKPSMHRIAVSRVTGAFIYDIVIDASLENKRELIYDLMHEMGHLFDSVPRDTTGKTTSSEADSEIRAWQFADKKIALYPELSEYSQEYSEYKRKRLRSYGVTL